MTNQKISKDELACIRKLEDFDLTMLISDVHDHGWLIARKTFVSMLESLEYLRDLPETKRVLKRSETEGWMRMGG